MNAAELTQALYAAKQEADDASEEYRLAIHFDAEAFETSKKAMARAYVTCREQQPKATVALIAAMVDLETLHYQKAARLAEGTKRAAGMAVETKRQWISSLQSLASLTKAEAQLATWTSREVESV